MDDLIVERRTVCNTKKNESIVYAIPRIPLNIFPTHSDSVFNSGLGCRPRKQHIPEVRVAHAMPFRLFAERLQCIDNILVARLHPYLRAYCYGRGGTLSKVSNINNDWQPDASIAFDFQRAIQLNVGIKPRPFNKHQMPIGLLPLILYRPQCPYGSDDTAQPNKDEGHGSKGSDACVQERPSLNVRCVISAGLCLFGLCWGLFMALRIDNERDFRRAVLSLLGGVFFAIGMGFWFFTFLHPHTWGLPPEWLPAKWNPCPQGYRDYFPHGQTVTQKHLTPVAFMYYSKDMANVLPTEKQIAIIGSLCEGSSIRAIERMTGVHRDTVMRLGVRVGQGCTAMMSETLRDLNTTRLEMDEIWGFIGKKEKHVRPTDDPTTGDVWTFCAIDADSKLVPTFKVGKRTNAVAEAFVQDVASRMSNRVQISTDGLKAYVDAIEHSFGGDVDYAQIIKTYGNQEITNNRRYSAPEFVSSEKRPVFGSPDFDLISTSYIERLNATTRLHMRRLTRLTLAFSKKLENFEAAVGLHFAYYNFVKRHNTLRATPAQAAGVTGTQWTVGELLKAVA